MTLSSDEDVGGGHKVLGGCRLVASMGCRVRIDITLRGLVHLLIEFHTGCSLNIVFFSKNFQNFGTSPSPALGCYWLYKKWLTNKSSELGKHTIFNEHPVPPMYCAFRDMKSAGRYGSIPKTIWWGLRPLSLLGCGIRPNRSIGSRSTQSWCLCCCFERILEDTVPPLDQTVRLRVVGGRSAVVDVVELALLSPVAVGELET